MLRPSGAAARSRGCSSAPRSPPARRPSSASGGAGDFRVVRWTTAEGLPQNTVTDVVELAGGELWLATFGGLARFDGQAFRVLDMAADEGLPANRIVKLAAVGPGSFLFLTQQGHLGRVEGGRAALLVPPPLPSLEALDLVVDRAGRVYCRAADGRVWRTDGRGGWRSVVDTPGGEGALHALALDESGDVWAVWGRRLLRLSGDAPGPTSRCPGDRSRSPPAPAAGCGSASAGRGAARGRTAGPAVDPAGARGEGPRDRPALGRRAVGGHDGGVSRIDREADGSWRRSSLPLPCPRPSPSAPCGSTGTGGLWVGTVGDGLLRVNRLPTRRFGAESGLADVAALAPDGAGGAFVASGCRNLFHLDGSGAARVGSRSRPEVARLLALRHLPRRRPRLFRARARSGARLFGLRRGRLEPELVAADLPFEEGPIASRPGRSRVGRVAGREAFGSSRPRGGRCGRSRLPAPLMSAAVGPDGALWLGGDGEVFRVVGDALDRSGPAEQRAERARARRAAGAGRDASGSARTGAASAGCAAGASSASASEQGLPDNSVSRILDDGRGRLWISTNRGLAVVREERPAGRRRRPRAGAGRRRLRHGAGRGRGQLRQPGGLRRRARAPVVRDDRRRGVRRRDGVSLQPHAARGPHRGDPGRRPARSPPVRRSPCRR